MSSEQSQQLLALLHQPRTIISLTMEAYGETAWWGCMFELQVADLLNWFCRSESDEEPHFRTRDGEEGEGRHSTSRLLQKIEKREFLAEGEVAVLKDAKEARDELIHRLVERNEVITKSDHEALLSEIINLRSRIIIGYEFAKNRKIFYAKKVQEQLGLPDDFFDEIVKRQRVEAEAGEEDVSAALRFLSNEMKRNEP